jgi:TRAP transporter TAXI family solute receptor
MLSRRSAISKSCLAFAALAVAPACGTPSGGASGTSTGGMRRLSIATGGTGGVFYPYGGGIAQVLSQHLPNVEATAEVTAASVDNLKFLKQGTSDVAFTMADIAQDGLAGRDAFADFGAVPARALAVLYPSYTHLVTTAGGGITKVADLRGKVVSLGSPGAGTTVLAERILAVAGIDPMTDLRAHYLGVAQAVDALKDGKVDAFFWNGGLPTAAILDLVNTQGITARLLPLDDVIPALQKVHGDLYYRATIPKDAYKLAADVPVVAVSNMLVVSETMEETLAHDITKTLFEQQATLAGIHPQARELSLDRALTGASIPFHPGAVRYYRERGVWKE